jgi:hypothetical protein
MHSIERTPASANTSRRITPAKRIAIIAKFFTGPFKNIADFIFPIRISRRQERQEMKREAIEKGERYIQLKQQEDNADVPTATKSTLPNETTEAPAACVENELKGERYSEPNLPCESAEEPAFDPVKTTKAHVTREEIEVAHAERNSGSLVIYEARATWDETEEATTGCISSALVLYDGNQTQEPSLTRIDSGMALNDADAQSINARFQIMTAQLAAGNLTGFLGIDADLTIAEANLDVIKRAKRKRNLEFHPDKNPGANKEEIAQLNDITVMVAKAAVDLADAIKSLPEFERFVKDINMLSKPAVDRLITNLAKLSGDPLCLKAFECAYRLVLVAGPRAYFAETAYQVINILDGAPLLRNILLDLQSAILVDNNTPFSIGLLNMELMMILPSRYSFETQEELVKLRELSYYGQC